MRGRIMRESPGGNSMAVLDLKSITRTEFNSLDARRLAGDENAANWFRELWDGTDPPACFICDRAIEGEHAVNGRPCLIVLPEITNDDLILAPLCRGCRDLPTMVRMSRSLKLLRKMHKARTGRNIGFCFAPRRGH
jgi:hypothetical protein